MNLSNSVNLKSLVSTCIKHYWCRRSSSYAVCFRL